MNQDTGLISPPDSLLIRREDGYGGLGKTIIAWTIVSMTVVARSFAHWYIEWEICCSIIVPGQSVLLFLPIHAEKTHGVSTCLLEASTS